MVIIRHPAVSNNWGPIQLSSVIRALGTCHFQVVWFQNYWIFNISAIMLIYANWVNYEKCSMVIIRHPAVSNNWGSMQLIYVTKAQGTNNFWVHWVLYQLENSKL